MVRIARPAGSIDPAGRAHHVRRALGAGLAIALLTASVIVVQSITKRSSAKLPAADVRAEDRDGLSALQDRLRVVPGDWNAWASLGAAYVQQARLLGDPSYYPKAQQALERSLSLRPTRNVQASIGLGALAAARHDFSRALIWGKRALADDPYSSIAYGVVGDALIELGHYPAAFEALQKMVDLRPGLASYARASYAWELQGNTPNAIRSLELALQAASSSSDAAFASYYLGELYWNTGRLAEASRFYARSAALDTTFVPAQQGLAKVEAARGNFVAAIAGYKSVVTRLPLPQYVAELGDLYEAAGELDQAEEQNALLHVQSRLFKANGVNIDLDLAIFDADHGVDLRGGLAAARREWNRRKSIFVADALAWSLYANHRYDQALLYARRALQLGTGNALLIFHKGMIEHALGNEGAARIDLARALKINPYFSFRWAPRAREILGAMR